MRRVALIGQPLRRRHSQVMHDAAFAASGLDARYELRELERDALAEFVEQVRDPAWFGFQVTAPYKTEIIPLLDEIEPQAAAIGAVNSVHRRDDGTLVGFNTDAPGFAAAVGRDLDVDLRGARVALVGAGGAARAVARAVVDGGAAALMIGARRQDRADALLQAVSPCATRVSSYRLDDPEFRRVLGGADLAVNATTVGMLHPGSAIDVAALPDGAAVFDLVYVPPETELIASSRARGLRATNGAEMLVAQAAIAFERWTGIAGMHEVMRQAVAPLLVAGAEP